MVKFEVENGQKVFRLVLGGRVAFFGLVHFEYARVIKLIFSRILKKGILLARRFHAGFNIVVVVKLFRKLFNAIAKGRKAGVLVLGTSIYVSNPDHISIAPSFVY